MPDNIGKVRPAEQHVRAEFTVPFTYRLVFTDGVLAASNPVLAGVFPQPRARPWRVLVCVDHGVAECWPALEDQVNAYFSAHSDRIELAGQVRVPGGEAAKNDTAAYEQVVGAINDAGICRQSFVIAIGGGAVLDVVGYAAATAHRGVRLIRLPTTTLAQGDAGIGVKNGINALGKKNFLGSFAVPWAVINDAAFLTTLSDLDWRCGFSEAVKVALVKDKAFFEQIEAAAPALHARDGVSARPIIQKCADLHLRHIVDGGDPFELTEARPLDFGHWAAHKLEQMTDWQRPHGEAVAIGIALDVIYAASIGMLDHLESERILTCLESLGFPLFDPAMNDAPLLLRGLEEFREHLGGALTVQMLTAIGKGVDVHEIDHACMTDAIAQLRRRAGSHR